jgi:hypothetical protein
MPFIGALSAGRAMRHRDGPAARPRQDDGKVDILKQYQ